MPFRCHRGCIIVHCSKRNLVTTILLSSLLLLLLLSNPCHAAARRSTFFSSRATTATATVTSMSSNHKSTKTQDDSAVLKELKDTIRKQAQEIQQLKKSIPSGTTAKASAAASAHHGAPAGALDGEYMSKSFLNIASARIGWLGLFLISLSFTAIIVNGFEHTLARQIELAFFMPLLAGHGGNTGGQTVGTILSAMSAGQIQLSDAPRVVSKEATSGLLVGTLLGACVAVISHYLMGISAHVSTVIFCTLPLVSTIASTLGSTIPFVCVALNLDPSVIAAPAMTSFVDVTGLLSYFLIANQIFHLFGLEL